MPTTRRTTDLDENTTSPLYTSLTSLCDGTCDTKITKSSVCKVDRGWYHTGVEYEGFFSKDKYYTVFISYEHCCAYSERGLLIHI